MMKLIEDFDIWWSMPKYKKKDIPAKQYSQQEILEDTALKEGWPGPEVDVKYWVRLENNKAVGFREVKPGKAEFPVYDI
mgnify:CR=1 FL=1